MKEQTKVKKTSRKKAATQDIDLDNPEFQNALRLLTYSDRSVFLTGKAGTGKSTFLKYIKETTKKKHVVLAPTGIAAVNVGGQTIHSFFKLPLKPLMPDDPDFGLKVLQKRMKYSSQLIKMIRELELVIIDEISMVRADIIDFIDKLLRVYSRNMRQPFGGKQMLFVGDIFQLEPVVTGETKDIIGRFYRTPYFFNAQVFRSFTLVPIELRKVYRQNEGEFIALLDRVRAGMPTREDIMTLNSRVSTAEQNGKEEKLTMTIATRRDMVDHINETRLNELTTPARTYYGKIDRDFPMASLPTDLELVLKPGAQVVFIKNDLEKRWVNGTIAIVESTQEDKVEVRTEDGVLHVVVPEIWNNVKYKYNEKKRTIDEEILGSFIQYPLKLAWALTIHKSQGLTFSNVIIDIGRGAFAGGQTYVALSRCRSMGGITLRSTINERDVYVNPAITSFARTFNDTRLIEGALAESRADSLYGQAAESFDGGDVAGAVDAFFEAMSLRPETGNKAMVRLIRQKLLVIPALRDEAERLRAEKAELEKKLDRLADEFVAMGLECGEESWEYDAAIANFDRAIELSPSHYPAWLGKGQMLADAGRADEAYDVLARAAKLNPNDMKPLLALGDLDLASGDSLMAMERYLAALDAVTPSNGGGARSDSPTAIPALERLASLSEDLGDDDAAEAYRRRLRHIKKNSNGEA